jgi:hypothetical protein
MKKPPKTPGEEAGEKPRKKRGKKLVDYDVGYGKPPVKNRFIPGKSGNPRGRPKERKNMKTIYRDALFEPITIQLNGKTKTVTSMEAIVLKLRNTALAGDIRATTMLLSLGKGLGVADAPQYENDREGPMSTQEVYELLKDHLEHGAGTNVEGFDDSATDEDDNQ